MTVEMCSILLPVGKIKTTYPKILFAHQISLVKVRPPWVRLPLNPASFGTPAEITLIRSINNVYCTSRVVANQTLVSRSRAIAIDGEPMYIK